MAFEFATRQDSSFNEPDSIVNQSTHSKALKQLKRRALLSFTLAFAIIKLNLTARKMFNLRQTMNKQLNITDGARALVLVAHPDDETIWMGGTILRYPKANWTIFSLCRGDDQDRAPKFRRVCEYLKARPIITDLEDEGKMTVEETIPVIKKLIQAQLGEKPRFDYVFTHGPNGEYSHPRHLGVNLATIEMIEANELITNHFLLLHFKKIDKEKEFSPLTTKSDPDYIEELTEEEFQAKQGIMTEIYGFDAAGIDVSYCTNPEAFKSHKS